LVLLGDCLEKLKELEDNSVDAVVTDPPYGWSFMGKAWDNFEIEKRRQQEFARPPRKDGKSRGQGDPSLCAGLYNQSVEGNRQFQAFTESYARELFRVLKPGGHMLVFCGPRTYHRMASGVEDAGFEIRDQLQWLFGSGFPKSHNLGNGIGSALKPANEPIVLARKPLSEKTLKANHERWGVGGLNIDASRIEGAPRTTHAAGNVVTCEAESGHMKGKKPHGPTPAPHGRWPANLLLDETAAEMLDQQVAETMPGMHVAGNKKLGNARKTQDSIFGMGSNDGPVTLFDSADTKPLASRFFYVAKASKRERNAGLEGMPEISQRTFASGGRTQIDGEWVETNSEPLPRKNHHPTVKPIKLMEYLIRLITPPNGTVLDPFAGSGSTGVAAVKNGFKFIGCEMSPEYVAIAERRIASVNG
jgi:DNA modification methylase